MAKEVEVVKVRFFSSTTGKCFLGFFIAFEVRCILSTVDALLLDRRKPVDHNFTNNEANFQALFSKQVSTHTVTVFSILTDLIVLGRTRHTSRAHIVSLRQC